VARGSVITLFLCGDVMIGRGIDQVQSRSVDPQLFEPSITSASDYVRLAETANGPIPRPVAPGYVWGEALDEIDAMHPDARIVNLETAVTTNPAAWPGKDVLYRTHPENVAVLRARGSIAAPLPTTTSWTGATQACSRRSTACNRPTWR
jgi:poly-gamma-glutamate capsule biosynthesis protein CapA/YwtB (metallophosphatase superfamily)